MKAKSKIPKKKAHKTIQGTATPNGESLTPPSLMVVPPETTIHLFDSSHWGSCKMEVYTHKSYIRRRDEGKWRSIIGSCANNHGAVVRALVPFVIQGSVSKSSTRSGIPWICEPCSGIHQLTQQ